MMEPYYDARNRICCYADVLTGVIEHEYKHVKTKVCLPIGGEYSLERDNTVTIFRRTEKSEFEIERKLAA